MERRRRGEEDTICEEVDFGYLCHEFWILTTISFLLNSKSAIRNPLFFKPASCQLLAELLSFHLNNSGYFFKCGYPLGYLLQAVAKEGAQISAL